MEKNDRSHGFLADVESKRVRSKFSIQVKSRVLISVIFFLLLGFESKPSRKNVKLPYHIRINIKEPRETEFADLKRRKNERFEDYQIRVHFDYLDRRESYKHLFCIQLWLGNCPLRIMIMMVSSKNMTCLARF